MSSKNVEKEKKSTVRVILNVPEDLNNVFNELAKKRGLAKSNMIIYAMSWFLDYNKSMDMMPKLIDLMKLNNEELKADIEGK